MHTILVNIIDVIGNERVCVPFGFPKGTQPLFVNITGIIGS